MTLRPLLCLLIVPWLAAPVAGAKGLGDLAPQQNAAKDKDGEKDKKGKKGEKAPEPPPPPSPESLYLRARLGVSTAMGLAVARADGQSWLASGMSDLGATWLVAPELVGGQFSVSGRYAALDVAPSYGSLTPREYATGVIELFLAGARWQRPLSGGMLLSVGGELGVTFTHLHAQIGSSLTPLAKRFGAMAVVSTGCDWRLLPSLQIGPKLSLGVGSYTVLQLGAQASFAF